VFQVLTVNGARVLDDVNPTASAAANDGSTSDDGNGGPTQQRRDMVLSSTGSAGGSNQQQIMAIGHAVDRVLFPLPVGDVLATMRADRQRRYNVFLRAVDEYCSADVRSLLTGNCFFSCDRINNVPTLVVGIAFKRIPHPNDVYYAAARK